MPGQAQVSNEHLHPFRPRRCALRVCLVIAALDLIALLMLLGAAELDVGPRLENARAIAALFGDSTKLGPITRRSLRHAVVLAAPDAVFLAIGGARPERGYSGACEIREWLLQSGVSGSRILVDFESFDTFGNLVAAGHMASSLHDRDVLIVVDFLHALRIRAFYSSEIVVGVRVVGHSLFDGSYEGVTAAIVRGQYELLAWTFQLLLPRSWYRELLQRNRENRGAAKKMISCSESEQPE